MIMTLSGEIGGAQNRFLNLYNEICKRKNDYYLLINRSLYETYSNNDFFINKEKIIVLNVGKAKSDTAQSVNTILNNKTAPKPKKKEGIFREIRRFFGKIKHKLVLIKDWMKFLIQLNKALRKNEITYVYAVWQGGMWSWMLLKLKGIKMAYGYMDASYASISKKLSKCLEQEFFALKNANIIDCLSPKIANDLKTKIGFKKAQLVSVTPNSFINYSKFQSAENKDNLIVFLSRLIPQKNPILFLESIVTIEKQLLENNYKVQIIGKGPMSDEISAFIKENNLRCVELINETFFPQEIISRSKVFISLQDDDNYPSQALLEAMACENIVVATNVGNTELLINKDTGFVVSKNRTEIANTILKIVTHYNDLIQLGKNARQKVTTEHTIDKFYTYFDSLSIR